jgi:nucleoside-diphosphate-sugar epimerase
LIVGCGCRGRSLGRALLAEGWAVRGTSRSQAGLEAIDAAGIEPAEADPRRPGTVLELVGDAGVVVWALGSADGPRDDLDAIHGDCLERLLERLVETPVRGFVYEAGGSVGAARLERGAALVREAAERWRIPVALPETSGLDERGWLERMLAAALTMAPGRRVRMDKLR